jgi:hypothetical protein
MGWLEKDKHFNFENLPSPLHGLFFLDGDILSKILAQKQANTPAPVVSPDLMQVHR